MTQRPGDSYVNRFQFVMEPRASHAPLAPHGGFRNSDYARDIFARETPEDHQVYNLGFLRIEGRETFQSFLNT